MDGCRMDIEGPRDLADGPAFLDQRDGKGLLIQAKLLGPSKGYASTFGIPASFVRSMPDQSTLELRDCEFQRKAARYSNLIAASLPI
jgi:hypothetical protein